VVFEHSPVTTSQCIESWQHRLGQVILHLQPWMCTPRGKRPRSFQDSSIRELLECMEHRVHKLTKIVTQQQFRIADRWTIAYIEHELSELLDVARKFDHSLRGGPQPEQTQLFFDEACTTSAV